jgi:hypothetical protein
MLNLCYRSPATLVTRVGVTYCQGVAHFGELWVCQDAMLRTVQPFQLLLGGGAQPDETLDAPE